MGYVFMFLMIGFLILIHELGHFCAAKWRGIPVRRFSIGFGPKLWSYDVGETEYRIAVFPVGGYVMPQLEALEDYFAFSLKDRILFAFAGPFANIVAAWLGLLVISVAENGLSWTAVCVTPFQALCHMTADFLQAIPTLFANPKQLSGVVGLVALGGKQIGIDLLRLLSLSVLLNINLAFLNLLPMLPMDGGKILLDILHRFRLPVRRLYVPVALTGWAVMLLLMLFVTVNDVSNLMT